MATAITIQATSSGPAAAGLPLNASTLTADHRFLTRHHQHPRMSSTTSPVASLTNSPSASSASFSSIATPNTTPAVNTSASSVAASTTTTNQTLNLTNTIASTTSLLAGSVSSRGPTGRDGVSCDACLFRKSRCAMNELVNKCYSCEFHRQDCTFSLANSALSEAASPPSRKRKLEDLVEAESNKRQSIEIPRPESTTKEMVPPTNTTNTNLLASPRLSYQSSQHIGLTTELEPILFEHIPLDTNDESSLSSTHKIRRFAADGTFMRIMNPDSSKEASTVSLDAIETLVAPYGSTLVDKFFEKIHPVFPVLMEDSFRQSYRTRRGLSPLLLAAVYTLTLKYLEFEPAARSARKPDVKRMEDTAMKLLTESLPHADITTIQAGMLIMQRSSLNTSSLNGQLVTAAFELGLHQDCFNWKIPLAERGLRRRMAWALHTQDKWCSLVHGRPSHMSAANWTVRDLVEDDFVGAFSATSPAHKKYDSNNEGESTGGLGHGPLLFCQHVALTAILAEILDTFYTLRAAEQFAAAGNNKTRYILEKAKPVQIRLKDWFARLPPGMKMDSTASTSAEILFDEVTEESASNGALHVAYFATEITLHRCIIRSLSPNTADNYLSHICRSAAKTRLISAMDFVNRLRPAHLQAFWPGSSRTNFALIGSFGTLLLATAPTREEAEFYRQRLAEYRWTLSVSVKNAQFLKHAIESLDLSTMLAQNVPEKPGIEELMAGVVAKKSKRVTLAGPVYHQSGTLSSAMDTTGLFAAGEAAGGGGATSSVVSGLASPATSPSNMDDMSDVDDDDDDAGEDY
ncbi:C6 transcription factor (OTam), putative [Talaromyces stipitatus ATCC 10500]|uniref:C6 transcription factor (OTam), putative n=1 Tax=Talaromyces stipitatus (strain ATCC 10500 / CBS 375.48 / QM 6759 / NRRL 1006) TaxID=441959 RepID=B8MTF4_TALSN|nr:C6 transcription factor (OTam), putative [Talaromyces stipitatus ATCC 10500]EED12286.1 C6 transcription factor (OTam), putative [Talaromyces stipitatus ATCC 10500]